MRFAPALPNDSPFAPRESIGEQEARTLARDLLGMTQAELSAAFRRSPMKRAKRRGLARNAAVASGSVGTAEDVPVLEAASLHDEPLGRGYAGWALARVARRSRGVTGGAAERGGTRNALSKLPGITRRMAKP